LTMGSRGSTPADRHLPLLEAPEANCYVGAMNTLEALTSRRSPLALGPEAPPREVVTRALEAGMCAPDHGKLRPWRFLLLEGEERNRLGEVMAEALAARDPEAPERLLEKERAKPLRAPMIITVVARLDPDHRKIPAEEQRQAVASAAFSIMLAIHAQGWGCQWKTGAAARDPKVLSALGLGPNDEIIAYLYVGVAAGDPPRPRREMPLEDFLLQIP